MSPTTGLVADLLAGADSAPAVLTADATVSRAELRAEVAGHRDRLRECGVRPGHTVALQVAPSVSYLALVLATLALEARALLLHAGLTGAECRPVEDRLRPAVAVRAPERSAIARFAARRTLDWAVLPEPAAAEPGAAVLQLSSGSTGTPKVIRRGEASIRAELAAIGALPDWVPAGGRLLTLNSLVHSFGLIGAVLHCLRVGAAVLLPDSAQPRELDRAITAGRPQAITGVPAHFELLTALPAGTLSGVRTCVSGGQLIRPAAHQAFVARHGCPLGQAYGMTEVGLIAADFGGGLAPAMGPPLPSLDVRVEAGEVAVGLADSPYLTGDAGRWRDGWLYTGDRGELRDGVLVVGGRVDSVLAVGGLKVDLAEVEEVLAAHPRVRAAVVVGAGESIEAFVESDTAEAADPAELHDWCRQRLAGHKRPRRIVLTDRLPRTSNGKLVRAAEALAAAASGGRA